MDGSILLASNGPHLLDFVFYLGIAINQLVDLEQLASKKTPTNNLPKSLIFLNNIATVSQH